MVEPPGTRNWGRVANPEPLPYPEGMQGRGAWRSRGFAIAAIALTFAVIAPEIAAPAGAAPARVELAGKRRRRQPVSAATRKARIVAAMKAKANSPAAQAKAATYRAAVAAKSKSGSKSAATPAAKPGAKPSPKPKAAFGPAAKRQRALAVKRLAAKKVALKRRAAANALIAKRVGVKKKSSSLSLPLLALYALMPFLLIGAYLLGSDYLRRREPRKPRGGGGPSLVITRVGNR